MSSVDNIIDDAKKKQGTAEESQASATTLLEGISKQMAIEINIQYPPDYMAQCDEMYYALRKAILLKEVNLHPVVYQVTEMVAKDIMNHPEHRACNRCSSVFLQSQLCPVCNN